MLHNLLKITSRAKKRLGRGGGSGKGFHTVGRGTKGHTSREGGTIPLWFEGGQLPLIKRLPYLRGKDHFDSVNTKPVAIDLTRIARLAGQDITPETLVAAGLIKSVYLPVKLVGSAKLTSVGEVRGVAASASARKALEEAGARLSI